MSKAFEGKVVLVTGANSGIGEAAAVRLQEAGATVFGLARREDALAAARSRHPRIHWLLADVTNEAQVTAAVQAAVKEGRRLDVVVNNAGIGAFAPLEQSTAEMVRSQFEVNVFGLTFVTRAALSALKDSRGSIVNVALPAISAATGPDLSCSTSVTSHDYNLLQFTAGGCTIDEPSPSHDIVGQDPRLGPLQNNGGPAPTRALLIGSPALDVIPPTSAACLSGVDQRGLGRPYPAGGACDIGAVEMQYPVITALVPAQGPLPGGAPVLLSGVALTGVLSISFGSLAVSTATISGNSTGTALTVTSPITTSPGAVSVQVTTSEGLSPPAPAAIFTYTVPLATPTASPTASATSTSFPTQTPTA